MNLTKSLKWAMSCAAITALSASAASWFEDDFDFSGSATEGRPILQLSGPPSGDWKDANGTDASKIAIADSALDLFCLCAKPLALADDKVLELNTEGATLIRKLPAGIDFVSAPVYVDMMVKFVLSEEAPAEPLDEVKALLYAGANSNLVVWSSYDGVYAGFTELTDDAKVDPEQWYRLTLTWKFWDDWYTAIFSIQLNGGEALISNVAGFDGTTGASGCWFQTAALSDMTDTTLSSIEFQGTGFIDELVVTDVLPTFTIGSGDLFFAGDSTRPVNATNYATWTNVIANATSISAAGGVKPWMYNAYLLNVDPGTVEAKLVITDIDPLIGIGAEIKLAAVNGKGVTVPFANPYGTLTISKTAVLGSAFVPVSDYTVTAGVYSVSGIGTEYFFKAEVK